MLLNLLHRTSFFYAGSARDSFNEVRLRPVDSDTQTCRGFDLRIDPAAEVRDYEDYYGNRVHYFDLSPAHHQLIIEAESEVETIPMGQRQMIPLVPAPGMPDAPPPSELYAEYLTDSHYVPLAPELWREAQDALAVAPRTDLWNDAVRIGHHVYSRFDYRPFSTGVNTKATDALALHCGVCQDFAHVMLGMCRTMQIPARYVSGYFFNELRRPGEIEASHAWVEILVPGFGWIGFDPTHDRPADDRYVKIASGRDYADIRPVSGTYRGSPTRELRVEVIVRKAGEEQAP